ncbi:MAG TPA: response regulator [Planctomycetota bacterium]|nr:response regulator [Planctomycetota bacterium]
MAYLLLVDDDEDFAAAAAKVLRGAGHEVHVALDTDSAVESMQQRRPDLAILDVMFPESSSAGFDLARQIRQDIKALRDVPLLMLTAVNSRFPLGFSSKDIDEHWLPVDDFLEKPVDLDLLCARVGDLLARAASQRPPRK